MPVVPTTDRQESLRQLPEARMPQPTRGAFGEALGRVAGQAVNIAAKMEQEEIRKANQVAMLDADRAATEFETDLLYNPDTGVLNLQGKGAIGSYDGAMSSYDDYVAKIEEGLANDDQRLSFRNMSQQRRAAIDRQLKRHIATETSRHDNEVTESWIANEKNRASKNYGDADVVVSSIALQKSAVADYARRNGKSADWLKERQQKIESDTHKAVIEQMVADGDDIGANDYYTRNSEAILDDARLREKVKAGASIGISRRAINDAWGLAGPKTDDDPVNIDKMLEIIEKTITDENAIRIAKETLKEKVAIHNAAVKERSDANNSAVWRSVAANSTMEQVVAMPQFKAMTGEDQVKVVEYYAKGGTSRESTPAQLAKYAEYAYNETLAGMSEDEIASLEPELGRALTKKLIDKKVKISDMDLSEIKLTDKMIKSIAVASGIDPSKKENKARMAELYDRTMAILADEQERKGYRLTEDEKRATMKREIENQVIVDSHWFKEDPSVPVFLLTPEQVEKVKIPSDKYREYEKGLRRDGKTVSEGKIRRLYLAMKTGNKDLARSIWEED